MSFLRASALAVCCAFASSAAAQSVVSNALVVPLHYTQISSGTYKLGIYASLGGGAPQIFEFDTGGGGFYAAYASADPGKSDWWGSAFTNTGTGATNQYDSGIRYEGAIVATAVSLYSDKHSPAPVVTTAPGALVGQMTSISNTNTGQSLWTPGGEVGGQPPVDGAFYGDFGMSLVYAHNGIANLVAQLAFTNGVIPGFVVRAHGDSPHLQIGLTTNDAAAASAFYFGMNADTNAPGGATFPNSGAGFYSEQVFDADMTISNATTNFTSRLGITTDTGASTTLHNAQTGGVPSALYTTDTNGKGRLVSGADFGLSGSTIGGSNVGFFEFTTTDTVNAGQVAVQDNKPDNDAFYLNSGITLFQQYDVIYNLHDGQIGFAPVPEPSTWALLAAAATLALVRHRARRASNAARS